MVARGWGLGLGQGEGGTQALSIKGQHDNPCSSIAVEYLDCGGGHMTLPGDTATHTHARMRVRAHTHRYQKQRNLQKWVGCPNATILIVVLTSGVSVEAGEREGNESYNLFSYNCR